MLSLRSKSTSLSRWQILLSVLGMVLVLVSGTLSVTHSHGNAIDDHGTCSLCVSAHAVAQIASAPVEVVTFLTYELLVPPTPIIRPRTVVFTAYFTRPPPVRVHIV
ncbi:hypothetical protein [Granulicella paludicola]|uniref:hypothetical protein n=1 Tax=Granulicella paludicola TaxID=474951 RepID=UPI0021DF8072|nr:hypothetical protein [Granulicella paludicola]